MMLSSYVAYTNVAHQEVEKYYIVIPAITDSQDGHLATRAPGDTSPWLTRRQSTLEALPQLCPSNAAYVSSQSPLLPVYSIPASSFSLPAKYHSFAPEIRLCHVYYGRSKLVYVD
jgi:hypothetical protein